MPVRYMVANGFSELRPPTVYPDVSPYSAMDGTNLNSNDEFPETDELFLEFSNASGKRKKKKPRKGGGGKARREERRAKRAEAKEARVSARKKRQDARADRKERKMALKEKEAQTQADVAKTVGQTSPEEQALLQQLAGADTGASAPEEKKGMSQGLKVGLIVGGIVVAGIVTILIVRNMKKSKK